MGETLIRTDKSLKEASSSNIVWLLEEMLFSSVVI